MRGWTCWYHHMAMVMLTILFMLKTKIKYKDTCELLSCDDIRELLYHFLPKRAVATDEVLRQMEIGYRLLKYTILNFHKQKFRKSD